MPRKIKVIGIGIHTKTNRCAHACRYCLMGRKNVGGVATDRHIALVDRFIAWRHANGRPEFQIGQAVNYAANISAEDQGQLMQLHKRMGWPSLTMRIHLGGLPIWSDDVIAEWFRARKAGGVETVHASLAGHGRVHDYWNNRKGDFEYLLKLFRAAAMHGLGLRQRLFVIKSTLPVLDDTIRLLDDIGEPVERYCMPFFYRGTALRYENERISKSDLRRLPAPVLNLMNLDEDRWRSEAEWSSVVRNELYEPQPVTLNLELNSGNIDELERSSCDEIIERVTARTQTAYDAVPSRCELVDNWSDASNANIYPYQNDVERLWLDRYLQQHPIKFERHITHLTDGH